MYNVWAQGACALWLGRTQARKEANRNSQRKKPRAATPTSAARRLAPKSKKYHKEMQKGAHTEGNTARTTTHQLREGNQRPRVQAARSGGLVRNKIIRTTQGFQGNLLRPLSLFFARHIPKLPPKVCVICSKVLFGNPARPIRVLMPTLSCDSCDSHSFTGFFTYGRNVSTSLLGPQYCGTGASGSDCGTRG